jgi:hypothetical protein
MPTPQIHANAAEKQKAYRARTEQARRDALQAKNLPPAPAIPTIPGEARWQALNAHALAALQTIQTEMQAYFDDRSETWQESDKGEAFQERIEAVNDKLAEWTDI